MSEVNLSRSNQLVELAQTLLVFTQGAFGAESQATANADIHLTRVKQIANQEELDNQRNSKPVHRILAPTPAV